MKKADRIALRRARAKKNHLARVTRRVYLRLTGERPPPALWRVWRLSDASPKSH